MRRVIKLYEIPRMLYKPFFEVNGGRYVVTSLPGRSLMNESVITRENAKTLIKFQISTQKTKTDLQNTYESLIDAIFNIEAIDDLILATKNFASRTGKYAPIFNKLLDEAANCVEQPDKFYDDSRKTLLFAISSLGKNSTENIKQITHEMQVAISEFAETLANAAFHGIKAIIPNRDVGNNTSSFIKSLLISPSENSYTQLVSTVSKAGSYKKYFFDPNHTEPELKSMIDQIVDFCNIGIKDIKNKFVEDNKANANTSSNQNIVQGAVPNKEKDEKDKNSDKDKKNDTAEKKDDKVVKMDANIEILSTLATYIKSREKKLIDLYHVIITVVIPAIYSVLAIYQILTKADFKETDMYMLSSRAQDPVLPIDRWQKLAGITIKLNYKL